MIRVTTCPICGGQDLQPFTSSPPESGALHHAQSRCRGCDLLIADPRATPEEIARYYASDYYREHWPDADLAYRENTGLYRAFDLRYLRELWAAWPPRAGGRVVEIGCGYGVMLPLLAELGYQPSGCDPSRDAVAACRSRGLDVVEGTATTAALAPPFVLTLCQQVIEHVDDPAAFVRSLVRLTEPGGVVAIVTEDAWSSSFAWQRLKAAVTGRRPAFHTSRDHTFVFSAPHLERLLIEAGCDAVRTRAFGYVAKESLHWKLYRGTFRMLDRLTGHGDYLMAVGRVGPRT